MLKLLISFSFGLVVAAVLLGLRQEYLRLNYENSSIHGQIEARQADLWSQQLRIAEATAPNAIADKVRQDRIPLAPAARTRGGNWLTPSANAAASDD
jgi:hypothetical protein